MLENCHATIAIVDDDEQFDKIMQIKDKLPHLRAIVKTMPPFGEEVKSSQGIWKWSELEEMNTDDVEEEYQRRLRSIVPTDCAFVSYTSGTTGFEFIEIKSQIYLIIKIYEFFRQSKRRSFKSRQFHI